MPKQYTALQLREHLKDCELQGRERPVLLDVREGWEWDICQIADSTHIPMQQIPAHLSQLEKDRELVVICHHGIRSLQVAGFLVQSGFSQVYNLSGGVDAWAREVEPEMAVY